MFSLHLYLTNYAQNSKENTKIRRGRFKISISHSQHVRVCVCVQLVAKMEVIDEDQVLGWTSREFIRLNARV